MFLDLYKNLSDDGKLIVIESGISLNEQIKEDDWSQFVILANGRKVAPDYAPSQEDYIVIRRIPGASATAVFAWVAIVVAVASGVAAGVSIYRAKQQQKKLREMQEAMSARDDVSNIPWLQGASNALATGKSQPYVVGRHLFTPYLLQQSFYKISGTDGINQDVYITLDGGFGPQAIRKISADDVLLYDFGNQTTPQRGSSYRPSSGLFKYFSGINDNLIQIEQNRALGCSGCTISRDFYIKHAVEEPNVQLPWREECEQWTATKEEEYTERVWVGDEDHGWWRNVKRTRTVTYTDGEIKTETKKFTLDPCSRNVEICLMFNGLCKYSDSGKKQNHTRTIGFRYSTDGGSSWSPLDVGGGSSSGGYYVVSWTRSVTSQIRYVKTHTFTWAQGKAAHNSGIPIMIEVTNRDKKSTAKGGAYEDCYVQWVQSEIFDAEKSKAADSFVDCKVLEDKEAALSTIITLKLRASAENEGKLGKINVITSGTARTWNGSSWSSAKTATSNPAAWLLEVLTSGAHPASQFADSENDLASFGALYTFCQTNGFSVDYVITQGQKKAQLLETICNVCRCMLYRNIYGKIAVAIDAEKENAVALLNAQNILGVDIKKSFSRKTDGLKLSWVDASSGYAQAETICMRPGVTRTADSIIREMDVTGITGYDHLMKYARYIMASEALRPKTVKVRTGAEGVYYTPYSKILMQDDSLRVGLGNATIRSVITSGGNIVGLKLNECIDLDDQHEYGVIINCVSDDYCSQLAKQITAPQGHARVDEILFETPFRVDSSVIPHAGDVLSYGYLGENGEFDRISSPYIITGIEPGENEVTLQLLDYDPDVYTTGAYGEYVPNITRKTEPYTPVIIPPPETPSDVEEILSGDNMEAPDVPVNLSVVATKDGLMVSCGKPDTSSIKNTIAHVVWELALDGIGPEDRPDDPHWLEYSTTGYEYLIPYPASVPYPEASDMYDWLVRCKFVSVYDKESDYGEYKTVDTDDYGTWLVQPPVITERTNKRSLHIHLEQPTGQREIYGNVRYQIQISRYDDIDGATRLWFKPNLSSAADPYGAETNYKVDTDPAPDPAYVVAMADFSQTVPLQGQSAQTPGGQNPSDTVYYFRVLAFNEAGVALDTNNEPYYAETNQMTARATGARDVVLAHMGTGDINPDALTAKHIYAENLTAIVGTFSQVRGEQETGDNFWKDMDTDNPEFRVGNDHTLEEQDSEEAEYIHYKDGSLAMRLKNFIVTVAETTIKGTLTLYNAAKTFRNLVSSAGMKWQKKVTDWLNPVDVAQIDADDSGNLTITNNPAALSAYQLAPPSGTIKIHHLEASLNDTDGNNTESLVAAIGGCGATAEPILNRLTSYFNGKLVKTGVVAKGALADRPYTAGSFEVGDFDSSGGDKNGYFAASWGIPDSTTKKVIMAVGNVRTETRIARQTFIPNGTGLRVAVVWENDNTALFGILYLDSNSHLIYQRCTIDTSGNYTEYTPIDLDARWTPYLPSSFTTDTRVFSVSAKNNKLYTFVGYSSSTYHGHTDQSGTTYVFLDGSTSSYISSVRTGSIQGEVNWSRLHCAGDSVYLTPYLFTYSGYTVYTETLITPRTWASTFSTLYSQPTVNHCLKGKIYDFFFSGTTIYRGRKLSGSSMQSWSGFTSTDTPFYVDDSGFDNETSVPAILYCKTNSQSFAKYTLYADGTLARETLYSSSSFNPTPDTMSDDGEYIYRFSEDVDCWYFKPYNQTLVAEKHYAFWFKGSSIRFGKVTILCDANNWLYCRLTASGTTVSWYIVKNALVNDELDVFATGSASLADYGIESDNEDLDFVLDGAVEEFTSDTDDITAAVMKKMVQYKLPYGTPGSTELLPEETDMFKLLAKDPRKVISNVIGASQVIPAGGAVTLSPGANPGQRLIFTALGTTASPCTITYTGILGADVTDTIKTVTNLEYTWTGSAWFCSSAPPIDGPILEQKPDELPPAAMYGGQWQEHNYGGVFFRSKGGDSCGFHAAYKVASWASGSSVTLAEDAVDGNGTAISANNYILVAVYGAASYYRKITGVSGRVLTLESALPSGYANLTEVIIGEYQKVLSHTHSNTPTTATATLNGVKTGGSASVSNNGQGCSFSLTKISSYGRGSSTGNSWENTLTISIKPQITINASGSSNSNPNSVAVCYWKRLQ